MAICGVITTKDVLRHTATIVREFGPGAYLRCFLAILRREPTTFLTCVFASDLADTASESSAFRTLG